MAERLDMLILGATGFTGIHCIPYIHKMGKLEGRNLTWGVSGRSEGKLKQALEDMGKKIGQDLSNIPIVLCDIKDKGSLLEMAKRTKIVLNCCGPFRFLGEPVVDACIEAGTHYVDVNGEPQYMEKIQLEKHEEAKRKGIYIISACGFDSIPTDLGVVFVQDKFEGVLNSVVTYLEAWEEGNSIPGPSVNYGTWESAVYGLAHRNELKDIRRKLFPTKLPDFKPKLQLRFFPHKSQIVDGWILPFPGSDRSVVKRSQRYFYEVEHKRPVQIDTQFVVKSLFHVILLIVAGLIFRVLTGFEFGRKLLLDYPSIFSIGMFSKDLPSEEKIERSRFQVTFYGEGWKDQLVGKNDQYSKPCDRSIIARVKGKNVGYGTTCICLIGAAIMIATESEKMPDKGGVYTPGAAFAKTSLIKLLNENEVVFEILEQKDI